MINNLKTGLVAFSALAVLSGCNSNQVDIESQKLKDKQEIELGKKLFFDTLLSKNGTQSCATCHNPDKGFVDDRENGVRGAGSLGDDGISIGDRNAPTAAYAMFSPKFHFDKKIMSS